MIILFSVVCVFVNCVLSPNKILDVKQWMEIVERLILMTPCFGLVRLVSLIMLTLLDPLLTVIRSILNVFICMYVCIYWYIVIEIM